MSYVQESLKVLREMGFSIAGIERCLDLPQGELEKRYYNKDAIAATQNKPLLGKISDEIELRVSHTDDPETVALMKIIRTFPWMIRVADHGFDAEYAKDCLVEAAKEALEKLKKE